MAYLIYDIKFYKVDDEGEEVTDKNGNVKLFEPEGRWKDLEYLCEDRDDDDFIEITNEVPDQTTMTNLVIEEQEKEEDDRRVENV